MKLNGKGKGQTIVLEEPIGLPEGQVVEVDISSVDDSSLTKTETVMATPTDAEMEGLSRYDSPAYRTFRPFPSTGRAITNEMVNKIREDMGI